MASGNLNRASRPNTWLHRPSCKRGEKPCQRGAVHTWHFCDMAIWANDVRSQPESGHTRFVPRFYVYTVQVESRFSTELLTCDFCAT